MPSSVDFNVIGFFNSILPLNQTNWASYFGPVIPDGVIAGIDDEMEVFGNSSGMYVYVKTGECRVRSHRGVISAQGTLDIAAADLTYDRIDLVVARVTYGDPSTMVIAVKTGNPAVTPTVPAVTQIAGDTWEIPLAEVYVAANVVTITAGNITDRRFVYKPGGVGAIAFSGTSLSVENDWEYRNNDAISSLVIALPDTPSDIWCCSVCFTSASSFSGVTFTKNGASYTPKVQGVSLSLSSVRYSLTIWWDGAYYWCNSEAA